MIQPTISIEGDRLVAAVTCGACDDGFTFDTYEANGLTYDRAVPCAECSEPTRRAGLFGRARIPARYLNATLDDEAIGGESQAEAFLSAHAWVAAIDAAWKGPRAGHQKMPAVFGQPAPGDILLAGPQGVGKTHVMAATARELTLRRGLPCLYVSFTKLVRQAKAAMSAKEDVQAIVDAVIQTPVLILDELGAGRATDWEAEIVHSIVCDRYDARRPTMWGTNYLIPPFPAALAHDSVEARIGPHAMSRISESAGPRMHVLFCADIRSRKGGPDGV